MVLRVFEMGEKREGFKLIRVYLPEALAEDYKFYCQLKGRNMTADLRSYIEQTLKDNKEILESIKSQIRED